MTKTRVEQFFPTDAEPQAQYQPRRGRPPKYDWEGMVRGKWHEVIQRGGLPTAKQLRSSAYHWASRQKVALRVRIKQGGYGKLMLCVDTKDKQP
jgi:hypothetical protein